MNIPLAIQVVVKYKYKYFKKETKMIKFREYVLEDAGNLKGLPKTFLKEITSYSELGGRNSKIVVFKENAKQKDVSAATRKVGGWVKSSDIGTTKLSYAELQAEADKKAYAGVLIKIDGEWVYFAKWDEYGDGAAKFQLITDKGNVTVKKMRSGKSKLPKNVFDSPWLKATQLSDYIDFEGSKVDVYLVTADADRLAKRQERKLAKKVPEVSKERKAAIAKFLNKKSGNLVQEIKDSLKEEIKNLNTEVEAMFSAALNGEKVEINLLDTVKKIEEKIETTKYMTRYMSAIIKDGNIKDTFNSNRYSYEYKEFKKLIDSLKEEEL
jgi:hypothetical protein